MPYLENIQFLGHLIYILPHYINFLPWYWQCLIYLVAGWFLFIGGLWLIIRCFGYKYPIGAVSYRGKFMKIPFFNRQKERQDVSKINLALIVFALFVFFLSKYLFWLPVLMFKIIIILVIFSYIYFYFVSYFFYGFMLFWGMFLVLVATQTAAILNLNMGFPDFTAHYIFTWWGYGIDEKGLIPLHNLTMNPTNYHVNYNQIIYIIITFIGYFWLFAYCVTWLRFRKIKIEKDQVINLEEVDLLTGESLKEEDNDGKIKNRDDQIIGNLKLLGISESTVDMIIQDYNPLIIMEIIESIKKSDFIQNPKEYFLNQLQEQKNGKS